LGRHSLPQIFLLDKIAADLPWYRHSDGFKARHHLAARRHGLQCLEGALKSVAESLSHDLVKGGRVTACLPSPASAPPVINRNATLQQWQNGMQAVILDLPGAALD
jgi:hypothetical protein